MKDLTAEYKSVASNTNCDFKIASARELTTFKGGGQACVFVPTDIDVFVRVYQDLIARGYVPYILGAGSNTVIADGLIKTPVISTERLNRFEYRDGKIRAECGVRLSEITHIFRQNGFGGFEFLSGVPATVGGAVKMNASAFMTQTADYVDEISVLTRVCDKYIVNTICKDEIKFSYRQGADGVILSALLCADTLTDEEKSKELSKKYIAVRKSKQPHMPSCGSVFKNGNKPSGKLIEDCGLKGIKEGGAQISDMHANFIVNLGDATAEDFMTLVRLCEKRVYEKYGIKLEREFVYLE